MRISTLYLSGPIAGIDDFRERFQSAEFLLAQAGFKVINPVNVDPINLGPGFEHEQIWVQWMRGDIAAMMQAHGIALLDGHENSKGAHVEKRIAFELGMPIMTVRQWEAIGHEHR